MGLLYAALVYFVGFIAGVAAGGIVFLICSLVFGDALERSDADSTGGTLFVLSIMAASGGTGIWAMISAMGFLTQWGISKGLLSPF